MEEVAYKRASYHSKGLMGRRPAGDGRWKWAVMGAAYSGILLLSTSAFMAGVLYVALLNKYPRADKATPALIVALNTGLLALLGPVCSIVVDKFSCRTSFLSGTALLIVSGLTSAFVNNLDWLLVTYGLIGGIGNSLVSVPFSITLGFYFDKRRSLVIAMSTPVIGLGMFIASPVALYFLENLSLDETFLAICAINCHLAIVGVICRPSAREIQIQKHNRLKARDTLKLDKDESKSKINNRKISKYCQTFLSSLNFNALSNVPFLVFLLSTLAWNVMLSICLLHLPNYASLLGASDLEITLLMTGFSVSNTIGRFLTALTVARSGLDFLALHVLALVLLGVATASYPLYSGPPGAMYVFAALCGLGTGAPNSLMTPITLDLVGLDNLSAAHGLELFFSGIGFLTGPPIAGFLYGRTGSYRNSFIFAGGINLVGGVLAFTARMLVRRRSNHLQVNDEISVSDPDKAEPDIILGASENLLKKSDPYRASIISESLLVKCDTCENSPTGESLLETCHTCKASIT